MEIGDIKTSVFGPNAWSKTTLPSQLFVHQMACPNLLDQHCDIILDAEVKVIPNDIVSINHFAILMLSAHAIATDGTFLSPKTERLKNRFTASFEIAPSLA